MALIKTDLSSVSYKKSTHSKRMLEIVAKEEELHLFINYSSLDIIQTCPRKAHFLLDRKLKRIDEAPALTVGTAVHKALEVWYSSSKEHKKRSNYQSDENIQLMLQGSEPKLSGPCARTAALSVFLEEIKDLRSNPDLGARDPSNVISILDNYFDHYLDEEFELYSDDQGPFVERTFELEIPGFDDVRIFFHGTIDMILRERNTNNLYVCDHKTTSSLGKDFFNRIKPNFQYTGYFWGAKEAFGLNPKAFIVNGIQIAKTKREFKRQVTFISDEEIKELHLALRDAAMRFIDYKQTGEWPMSAPNSCSMWGGCEFRQVCEMDSNLRENVISMEYSEGASK